ncbi:dual specificity protein phosphatase 23 isoform X2 [Anabrus simplex]|uniref:dual specificity protein phosphatase 23 isoform X2 n=1 Tax=Anabrus simplex TaxID=316456 RepID=UPI0034DCFEF0
MSKVEDLGCSYSPWNFSWIDENKLAAMAWPQTPANLRFLVDLGIKCLVTLSPEMRPPIHAFPELSWVEIPIEEFEPPTISQIYEFIDVCKRYLMDNKQTPDYPGADYPVCELSVHPRACGGSLSDGQRKNWSDGGLLPGPLL